MSQSQIAAKNRQSFTVMYDRKGDNGLSFFDWPPVSKPGIENQKISHHWLAKQCSLASNTVLAR